MYYSVTDSDFNILDMYSAARRVLKKVSVKIGEMVFVLFISSGVGYAQEPIDPIVDSQQPLVEMASNVHYTPITYDISNGQLVTFDKILIPDLQYAHLIKSLMNHKGGKMTPDFLHSFESLASHLAKLPFRESLARYSIVNDFVNINMVFDMGIELEITQFPDVDDVAFSIHHDGATLAVGTAAGSVIADKMLTVLNETKTVDGLS